MTIIRILKVIISISAMWGLFFLHNGLLDAKLLSGEQAFIGGCTTFFIIIIATWIKEIKQVMDKL